MEKKQIEAVAAAKKQIVEGQLTIWSTRLSALVDAGDFRAALDTMVSPVELASNNCGCNAPCDALTSGALQGVSNPNPARG